MPVRLAMGLLLCTVFALAQHAQHEAAGVSAEVPLFEGLGPIHMKVSTNNEQAQRYFDQGLAFLYGFNHDEASRSFRRAAELDPKVAMAYWGIAHSVGPNYNDPSDPERMKAAYEAIQKAVALSNAATERERAYINALAKRFTPDDNPDTAKLAQIYKEAMAEVVRRWPDDLHAATLYAESAMNLRPWKLWNKDGTPAPGTEEIVATLESVLKRDPDHTGANHYYIHAVEASKSPERALPSAMRLENLKLRTGHLVHMPAHIFLRVGDYVGASETNVDAAATDRNYLQQTNLREGIYPWGYYSHNMHFQAYADAMAGRYAKAMDAVNRLEHNVEPHAAKVPMLETFMPTRSYILVRFARWDEILSLPKPAEALNYQTGMWHFGRGMAHAAKGDTASAGREHAAMMALEKQIPDGAMADRNSQRSILSIASHMLQGNIARARKDYAGARAHLEQAVAEQDALVYIEPPEWFTPMREELGFLLLESGDHAAAERTFRDDLDRNPRSGRSLYGLALALEKQGRAESARLVRRQFQSSWQHADTDIAAIVRR